jgi:hypothetical protein
MDPFQGALIPPVVEGLAVQVLKDSLTAAAFHDGFQEVIQSVRLKNEGTTDLELTLWALSSNIKVTSGDGNPARLRLEPGQEQQVDLSWHLEPQLPANEAILLWLGWSDGDRTTVTSGPASARCFGCCRAHPARKTAVGGSPCRCF